MRRNSEWIDMDGRCEINSDREKLCGNFCAGERRNSDEMLGRMRRSKASRKEHRRHSRPCYDWDGLNGNPPLPAKTS